MLLIDNAPLSWQTSKPGLLDIVLASSFVKEASKSFSERPVFVIGGKTWEEKKDAEEVKAFRPVFASQKEVVSCSLPTVSHVGSDEATTCVITTFFHRGSGKSICTHLGTAFVFGIIAGLLLLPHFFSFFVVVMGLVSFLVPCFSLPFLQPNLQIIKRLKW